MSSSSDNTMSSMPLFLSSVTIEWADISLRTLLDTQTVDELILKLQESAGEELTESSTRITGADEGDQILRYLAGSPRCLKPNFAELSKQTTSSSRLKVDDDGPKSTWGTFKPLAYELSLILQRPEIAINRICSSSLSEEAELERKLLASPLVNRYFYRLSICRKILEAASSLESSETSKVNFQQAGDKSREGSNLGLFFQQDVYFGKSLSQISIQSGLIIATGIRMIVGVARDYANFPSTSAGDTPPASSTISSFPKAALMSALEPLSRLPTLVFWKSSIAGCGVDRASLSQLSVALQRLLFATQAVVKVSQGHAFGRRALLLDKGPETPLSGLFSVALATGSLCDLLIAVKFAMEFASSSTEISVEHQSLPICIDRLYKLLGHCGNLSRLLLSTRNFKDVSIATFVDAQPVSNGPHSRDFEHNVARNFGNNPTGQTTAVSKRHTHTRVGAIASDGENVYLLYANMQLLKARICLNARSGMYYPGARKRSQNQTYLLPMIKKVVCAKPLGKRRVWMAFAEEFIFIYPAKQSQFHSGREGLTGALQQEPRTHKEAETTAGAILVHCPQCLGELLNFSLPLTRCPNADEDISSDSYSSAEEDDGSEESSGKTAEKGGSKTVQLISFTAKINLALSSLHPEHFLKRTSTTSPPCNLIAPWVCDGGGISPLCRIDGGVCQERWRCCEGCDFDLCDLCVRKSAMVVEDSDIGAEQPASGSQDKCSTKRRQKSGRKMLPDSVAMVSDGRFLYFVDISEESVTRNTELQSSETKGHTINVRVYKPNLDNAGAAKCHCSTTSRGNSGMPAPRDIVSSEPGDKDNMPARSGGTSYLMFVEEFSIPFDLEPRSTSTRHTKDVEESQQHRQCSLLDWSFYTDGREFACVSFSKTYLTVYSILIADKRLLRSHYDHVGLDSGTFLLQGHLSTFCYNASMDQIWCASLKALEAEDTQQSLSPRGRACGAQIGYWQCLVPADASRPIQRKSANNSGRYLNLAVKKLAGHHTIGYWKGRIIYNHMAPEVQHFGEMQRDCKGEDITSSSDSKSIYLWICVAILAKINSLIEEPVDHPQICSTSLRCYAQTIFSHLRNSHSSKATASPQIDCEEDITSDIAVVRQPFALEVNVKTIEIIVLLTEKVLKEDFAKAEHFNSGTKNYMLLALAKLLHHHISWVMGMLDNAELDSFSRSISNISEEPHYDQKSGYAIHNPNEMTKSPVLSHRLQRLLAGLLNDINSGEKSKWRDVVNQDALAASIKQDISFYISETYVLCLPLFHPSPSSRLAFLGHLLMALLPNSRKDSDAGLGDDQAALTNQSSDLREESNVAIQSGNLPVLLRLLRLWSTPPRMDDLIKCSANRDDDGQGANRFTLEKLAHFIIVSVLEEGHWAAVCRQGLSIDLTDDVMHVFEHCLRWTESLLKYCAAEVCKPLLFDNSEVVDDHKKSTLAPFFVGLLRTILGSGNRICLMVQSKLEELQQLALVDDQEAVKQSEGLLSAFIVSTIIGRLFPFLIGTLGCLAVPGTENNVSPSFSFNTLGDETERANNKTSAQSPTDAYHEINFEKAFSADSITIELSHDLLESWTLLKDCQAGFSILQAKVSFTSQVHPVEDSVAQLEIIVSDMGLLLATVGLASLSTLGPTRSFNLQRATTCEHNQKEQSNIEFATRFVAQACRVAEEINDGHGGAQFVVGKEMLQSFYQTISPTIAEISLLEREDIFLHHLGSRVSSEVFLRLELHRRQQKVQAGADEDARRCIFATACMLLACNGFIHFVRLILESESLLRPAMQGLCTRFSAQECDKVAQLWLVASQKLKPWLQCITSPEQKKAVMKHCLLRVAHWMETLSMVVAFCYARMTSGSGLGKDKGVGFRDDFQATRHVGTNTPVRKFCDSDSGKSAAFDEDQPWCSRDPPIVLDFETCLQFWRNQFEPESAIHPHTCTSIDKNYLEWDWLMKNLLFEIKPTPDKLEMAFPDWEQNCRANEQSAFFEAFGLLKVQYSLKRTGMDIFSRLLTHTPFFEQSKSVLAHKELRIPFLKQQFCATVLQLTAIGLSRLYRYPTNDACFLPLLRHSRQKLVDIIENCVDDGFNALTAHDQCPLPVAGVPNANLEQWLYFSTSMLEAGICAFCCPFYTEGEVELPLSQLTQQLEHIIILLTKYLHSCLLTPRGAIPVSETQSKKNLIGGDNFRQSLYHRCWKALKYLFSTVANISIGLPKTPNELIPSPLFVTMCSAASCLLDASFFTFSKRKELTDCAGAYQSACLNAASDLGENGSTSLATSVAAGSTDMDSASPDAQREMLRGESILFGEIREIQSGRPSLGFCCPTDGLGHKFTLSIWICGHMANESLSKYRKNCSAGTADNSSSKITIGERVVRGPSWSWGDQDGGKGLLGTVVELCPWSSVPNRGVKVHWDRTGVVNTYRWGAEGGMFDVAAVDDGLRENVFFVTSYKGLHEAQRLVASTKGNPFSLRCGSSGPASMDAGGAGWGLEVVNKGQGKIKPRLYLRNTDRESFVDCASSIFPRRWTNVCIVKSSEKLRMFINGICENEAILDSRDHQLFHPLPRDASPVLYFGEHLLWGHPYESRSASCLLAKTSILADRALSDNEVLQRCLVTTRSDFQGQSLLMMVPERPGVSSLIAEGEGMGRSILASVHPFSSSRERWRNYDGNDITLALYPQAAGCVSVGIATFEALLSFFYSGLLRTADISMTTFDNVESGDSLQLSLHHPQSGLAAENQGSNIVFAAADCFCIDWNRNQALFEKRSISTTAFNTKANASEVGGGMFVIFAMASNSSVLAGASWSEYNTAPEQLENHISKDARDLPQSFQEVDCLRAQTLLHLLHPVCSSYSNLAVSGQQRDEDLGGAGRKKQSCTPNSLVHMLTSMWLSTPLYVRMSTLELLKKQYVAMDPVAVDQIVSDAFYHSNHSPSLTTVQFTGDRNGGRHSDTFVRIVLGLSIDSSSSAMPRDFSFEYQTSLSQMNRALLQHLVLESAVWREHIKSFIETSAFRYQKLVESVAKSTAQDRDTINLLPELYNFLQIFTLSGSFSVGSRVDISTIHSSGLGIYEPAIVLRILPYSQQVIVATTDPFSGYDSEKVDILLTPNSETRNLRSKTCVQVIDVTEVRTSQKGAELAVSFVGEVLAYKASHETVDGGTATSVSNPDTMGVKSGLSSLGVHNSPVLCLFRHVMAKSSVWKAMAKPDRPTCEKNSTLDLVNGICERAETADYLPCSCPHALLGQQTIESDHPYAHNDDQSWEICISGADVLVVDFDSRSRTAHHGDYVSISGTRKASPCNCSISHDKGSDMSQYSPKIGIYSGRAGSQNWPATEGRRPLFLKGSTCSVHFVAKSGFTDWGFRASITGYKLTTNDCQESKDLYRSLYSVQMNEQETMERWWPAISSTVLDSILCLPMPQVPALVPFLKDMLSTLLDFLHTTTGLVENGDSLQIPPNVEPAPCSTDTERNHDGATDLPLVREEKLECKHPYENNTEEVFNFIVPGARKLVIHFDPLSRTEKTYDFLRFYRTERHDKYWGEDKYSGGRAGSEANWPGVDGRPPLIIPANSFSLLWKTDASKNDWGWRMRILCEMDSQQSTTLSLSTLRQREHLIKAMIWDFYSGGTQRETLSTQNFSKRVEVFAPANVHSLSFLPQHRLFEASSQNLLEQIRESLDMSYPTCLDQPEALPMEFQVDPHLPLDTARLLLQGWSQSPSMGNEGNTSQKARLPIFSEPKRGASILGFLNPSAAFRGLATVNEWIKLQLDPSKNDSHVIESEHPLHLISKHEKGVKLDERYWTVDIPGATALRLRFHNQTAISATIGFVRILKNLHTQSYWGSQFYAGDCLEAPERQDSERVGTWYEKWPGVLGQEDLIIPTSMCIIHLRYDKSLATSRDWGFRLEVIAEGVVEGIREMSRGSERGLCHEESIMEQPQAKHFYGWVLRRLEERVYVRPLLLRSGYVSGTAEIISITEKDLEQGAGLQTDLSDTMSEESLSQSSDDSHTKYQVGNQNFYPTMTLHLPAILALQRSNLLGPITNNDKTAWQLWSIAHRQIAVRLAKLCVKKVVSSLPLPDESPQPSASIDNSGDKTLATVMSSPRKILTILRIINDEDFDETHDMFAAHSFASFPSMQTAISREKQARTRWMLMECIREKAFCLSVQGLIQRDQNQTHCWEASQEDDHEIELGGSASENRSRERFGTPWLPLSRHAMSVLSSEVEKVLTKRRRYAYRQIIESKHNYEDNSDLVWSCNFPHADHIQVVFDSRSRTERGYDYVRFHKDDNRYEIYGAEKYSGGRGGSQSNWPGVNGFPPLHIPASSVVVTFRSDSSNNDWGFRMILIGIILDPGEAKLGKKPPMGSSLKGDKIVQRPSKLKLSTAWAILNIVLASKMSSACRPQETFCEMTRHDSAKPLIPDGEWDTIGSNILDVVLAFTFTVASMEKRIHAIQFVTAFISVKSHTFPISVNSSLWALALFLNRELHEKYLSTDLASPRNESFVTEPDRYVSVLLDCAFALVTLTGTPMWFMGQEQLRNWPIGEPEGNAQTDVTLWSRTRRDLPPDAHDSKLKWKTVMSTERSFTFYNDQYWATAFSLGRSVGEERKITNTITHTTDANLACFRAGILITCTISKRPTSFVIEWDGVTLYGFENITLTAHTASFGDAKVAFSTPGKTNLQLGDVVRMGLFQASLKDGSPTIAFWRNGVFVGSMSLSAILPSNCIDLPELKYATLATFKHPFASVSFSRTLQTDFSAFHRIVGFEEAFIARQALLHLGGQAKGISSRSQHVPYDLVTTYVQRWRTDQEAIAIQNWRSQCSRKMTFKFPGARAIIVQANTTRRSSFLVRLCEQTFELACSSGDASLDATTVRNVVQHFRSIHESMSIHDDGQQPDMNTSSLEAGYRYLCCPQDLPLGTMVVRGRNWKWGEEDGGPGCFGVVTKSIGCCPRRLKVNSSNDENKDDANWVWVRWVGSGNERLYRWNPFGSKPRCDVQPVLLDEALALYVTDMPMTHIALGGNSVKCAVTPSDDLFMPRTSVAGDVDRKLTKDVILSAFPLELNAVRGFLLSLEFRITCDGDDLRSADILSRQGQFHSPVQCSLLEIIPASNSIGNGVIRIVRRENIIPTANNLGDSSESDATTTDHSWWLSINYPKSMSYLRIPRFETNSTADIQLPFSFARLSHSASYSVELMISAENIGCKLRSGSGEIVATSTSAVGLPSSFFADVLLHQVKEHKVHRRIITSSLYLGQETPLERLGVTTHVLKAAIWPFKSNQDVISNTSKVSSFAWCGDEGETLQVGDEYPALTTLDELGALNQIGGFLLPTSRLKQANAIPAIRGEINPEPLIRIMPIYPLGRSLTQQQDDFSVERCVWSTEALQLQNFLNSVFNEEAILQFNSCAPPREDFTSQVLGMHERRSNELGRGMPLLQYLIQRINVFAGKNNLSFKNLLSINLNLDILDLSLKEIEQATSQVLSAEILDHAIHMITWFHRCVLHLLPFVEFLPRTTSIHPLLNECSLHKIFSDARYFLCNMAKLEIWERVLEHTKSQVTQLEVKLNRRRAAIAKVYVSAILDGNPAAGLCSGRSMACRNVSWQLENCWLRNNCHIAKVSASHSLYLRLYLETMFGQAFLQLHTLPAHRLRQHGQVYNTVFLGERGHDAGGLYRESLSEFCKELQSNALPLLLPTPNQRHAVGSWQHAWMPNPQTSDTPELLEMLAFFGKLIGVALRNKELLQLHMPPLFWKHLLGESLDFNDLECLDVTMSSALQEAANNFQQLSEITSTNSISQVTEISLSAQALDLGFVTIAMDGREEELKPGGSETKVDVTNWKEFISLTVEYQLHQFDKQMTAIASGLSSVVPFQHLTLFTWHELESAVCGVAHIDVELLRANTDYVGCSDTDNFVLWFWEVLESRFSNRDRSKFLKFVWGRSRLPLSGKEFAQKFKIQPLLRTFAGSASGDQHLMQNGHSADQHLPIAHTCFFTLELPTYSNKATLEQKLRYAMEECQVIDADNTHSAVAAASLGWDDNLFEAGH